MSNPPEARLLGASETLTAEQQAAVERVEKLLRTAGRGGPEAAAFAAKAQDILIAYNLDMEIVEAHTGEGGKRVDERLKGGHMQFQRDLWQAVAELNFCLYWNQISIIEVPKWVPNKTNSGMVRVFNEKRQREHRVVGRIVNARMTRVMAEYLEQAIERALIDELHARGRDDSQLRGTWATSFKEGAAGDIVQRLNQRRKDMLSAERKKAAEAASKAHAATVEGETDSRGLVLYDLAQREEEANWDALYGEGWSARQKAAAAERRQRQAAANAAADAAYLRWREQNPERAAEQDAKRRKAREEDRKREERNAKRRERYWETEAVGRPEKQYKGDSYAYAAGARAGAKISIDQQTDRTKTAGSLG